MLNTKFLMTSSAIVVGLLGLACSFAPHEIINFFGHQILDPVPVFIQLLGAASLGFAILNWMSKGLTMDGIYARPLVMANFLHFTVAGLALVKTIAQASEGEYILYALSAFYSIYAIWFARILFTHPLKEKE